MEKFRNLKNKQYKANYVPKELRAQAHVCVYCKKENAQVYWEIFHDNNEHNAYHKVCLELAHIDRLNTASSKYTYKQTAGSYSSK